MNYVTAGAKQTTKIFIKKHNDRDTRPIPFVFVVPQAAKEEKILLFRLPFFFFYLERRNPELDR
jgi:hypothetical protein